MAGVSSGVDISLAMGLLAIVYDSFWYSMIWVKEEIDCEVGSANNHSTFEIMRSNKGFIQGLKCPKLF